MYFHTSCSKCGANDYELVQVDPYIPIDMAQTWEWRCTKCGTSMTNEVIV